MLVEQSDDWVSTLTKNDLRLFRQLKEKAIALLARREHSEYELITKLTLKFNEAVSEQPFDVLVQNAVLAMQTLGYQSDHRFVSAFVRSKASAFNGPLKIQQALSMKGIERVLFKEVVEEEAIDFFELAAELMARKFTLDQLLDYKSSQKSFRYMANRGFNVDQIKYAKEKLLSEP